MMQHSRFLTIGQGSANVVLVFGMSDCGVKNRKESEQM